MSSIDSLEHYPPPPSNPASPALSHSMILRERRSDVFKKYEIVQTIGEGAMGRILKVKLRDDHIGGSAFHVKTKGLLGLGVISKTVQTGPIPEKSQEYVYALKSIMLDRFSRSGSLKEMKNEIEILRNMDHPNIVKAYEVYTCKFKRQIFLLMELCEGGDLFERSPYSEKQAALIVNQLLSAVEYMHKHGIVHRDLKFENIMFASKRPDSEIKVIDFGLSKKFRGAPGFMLEKVGTIYTMSPQVLQGMYSSKADLWSVGVITFMLISSARPFYHKQLPTFVDLIMRADYNFSAPVWQSVSDDAKDFISHLLVVDTSKRFSAEQAIKHKWIVNRELLPDEIPSAQVLARVDHSMMNYRHTSELKKLALTVVAHRSSQSKIIELRKVFEHYDTAQSGVLSFQEFRAALKNMNYSDDVVADMFSSIVSRAVPESPFFFSPESEWFPDVVPNCLIFAGIKDTDKDGEIMWTEFLAATIEAIGDIEEDRIAEAFDFLDSDGTGFISAKDLRQFLGADCSKEQLKAIILSVNKNSDGKVSYDMFLQAFREQSTELGKSLTDIETEALP